MSFRNIDNVTILAEVGENISLPSTLIAMDNNNNMVPVGVEWEPNVVDTSEEKEMIFVGRVRGYVHDVLCSVHVSRLTDNPESVFPYGDSEGNCEVVVGGHCIDDFGLPKRDIHTSDIPDIDDYQYFKAKAPRTQVEEMQLKQLRELLADKIILARDINHLRNAVIAIEEFLADISNRLDELEERVDVLEDLIADMVVDGVNIGGAVEVFSHKSGGYADNVLNFRTLEGIGADIREEGDRVVIEVDEIGCGQDVQADSFITCGNHDPRFEGTTMGDGYLKFSDHFGMKMVEVKNRDDRYPGGTFPSMLWVMGQGKDMDTMEQAGRMLKGAKSFIMEYKTNTLENSSGGYSGIVIDDNGARLYSHSPSSLIDAELAGGFSAYSPQGSIIPD